MILRSVFLLLLTAVAGFGYTAIPEQLQVGAYSVALRCNTHWSAQVHEREGVVRYDYVQHPVGIQFMVARVALPADAATVDEAVLAERLIRKNELKFHHTSFGQRVSFPRRTRTSEVPAGRAHVFGDDRPISRGSSLRFAKAALLLPPDFRTRRVGFLITAHQAGGGDHAKLEQDDYFTELLTGLREEKNRHARTSPYVPRNPRAASRSARMKPIRTRARCSPPRERRGRSRSNPLHSRAGPPSRHLKAAIARTWRGVRAERSHRAVPLLMQWATGSTSESRHNETLRALLGPRAEMQLGPAAGRVF